MSELLLLLQNPGVIFLLLTVTACGLTDMRTGHIMNAVTYPAIATGVILSASGYGMPGMDAGSSALGLVAGFLPLFLIYLVKGAGGGDVKLMAAVGAFGGAIFSLSTLFWSLLLGSLMGLVQAAWSGQLKGILQRVFFTLFHSVLPGIGPISHLDKEGPTIHFGMAICLGTWITLIAGIPKDVF